MGLILIAIITGVVSSILYGEFAAWAPKLAKMIIARSASAHPGELGERLHEEWLALLAEIPAPFSQVALALNFALASIQIRLELSLVSALVRAVDIAGSLLALVVLAPLVVLVTIGTKLMGHGSAIATKHMELPDGRVVHRIMFSTTRSGRVTALGRFLLISGVSDVPSFVNVLCGSMSLVDIFRVSDSGEIVFDRPGICSAHTVEGEHFFSRRLRELHRAHRMRPRLTTHIQIVALTMATSMIFIRDDVEA